MQEAAWVAPRGAAPNPGRAAPNPGRAAPSPRRAAPITIARAASIVFAGAAPSLLAAAAPFLLVAPARAQQDEPSHPMPSATPTPAHEMWMTNVGGWRLMGMAQAFPVLTVGAPGEEGPLRETEAYLTQGAVMADLLSPGGRWLLRTTLNFEGPTQGDGELTFGAWGEGFIDRRHPHTLVHELVVSVNAWDAAGGALSLSAGKGFAPYGTDDPMGRPGLKYPTNHHLSQILERWLVAAAFLREDWSVEAGVFGGAEPDGPYDFSNIESFGDSWSARVARRWGGGVGPLARWEASGSYGSVSEEQEGRPLRTSLWNAALRHAGPIGGGDAYALVEASLSDPETGDGDYSVLAEGRLSAGPHRPYARLEVARRPEFAREGGPGERGFFRYDHDAAPIGATRWIIATLGYGFDATALPVSVRPFVDAQYHSVREGRGGIEPEALLGTSSFWTLSFGGRVFFGGEPMRMGAYGVLDPMVAGHAGGHPEPMEMPGAGTGRPHGGSPGESTGGSS